MAARQIIVPGAMPSRDANGRSLAGFLRFYAPGTTLGVPKTVYKDSGLSIPHDFPIASDGAGRWPQIWADEAELFDVGWSDQVNDAFIASFTNIQPVKDALLASATLAQTAAEQAVIARDQAQEIADKFGDVDAAITAAQNAQEAAETAAGTAGQILNGPGGVVEMRDQTKDYRDEAKEYRDQAEAIVGFDPTYVVRTDGAQSFDATHQAQGRTNIGAQPLLGIYDREKVQALNVASGVVTVDLANGSVAVVNQTAAITSLVVNNVPAGADETTFTLVLKVNGGSSFAPGAAFKPVNNVNPTLSGTANDENYLVFTTRNAGTAWAYFYQGFIRP